MVIEMGMGIGRNKQTRMERGVDPGRGMEMGIYREQEWGERKWKCMKKQE